MTHPNQSFDAFAAAYDHFSEATFSPIVPSLETAGVRLAGRALDLGCGSGRYTAEFADVFDEVVGVDLSVPLIEIARERRRRPNVKYVVGDLCTFDDPDGFDLVFSSTALHHVADLGVALNNIRRLVRPNGWAVLRDTIAMSDPRRVWLWRHGGVYLGPLVDFPAHWRAHGPAVAWQLLRFQIGRPFIKHLLADRWLTFPDFQATYTDAFPGGRVTRSGGLAGLVWHRPA